MPLSEAKIAVIAGVLAAAPDDVLHRLESLLASAKKADPTFEPVHALAAVEADRRAVIAAVFAPLLPLTVGRLPLVGAKLTVSQIRAVWLDMSATDPDLARSTLHAIRAYWSDDMPPPEFDLVCRGAAELAKDQNLARLLRLSPLLRSIKPRLADWTHNPSSEHIAAIRIAFKDALALDADASTAFWDAIMAMLNHPWQVVRLISAAIDRPSDRYLAESELAEIGERVLDDIDARLNSLKRFDPTKGEEAGAAEAASVLIAVQEITEFEAWLTLRKDGPWGQRIGEQRKALSLLTEARLRETEPAVAVALPTQTSRGVGKMVRSSPKLVADPQLQLVARARALLTLLGETRPAAASGGFTALRTKTVESLENRLDPYCEDLIEILHRRESEDLGRVRAYLDIAADFSALIKGPQVAQLIRRRAAAA